MYFFFFLFFYHFCLLTVRHNSYDLFARFIECTSFRQEFELCYRRKKQRQRQEQQEALERSKTKKSSRSSFSNKLVMFPKNPFHFKLAGKRMCAEES